MADINAYLREAINGPAPQHKTRGRTQFEPTEGSDGALHTKIVGADGEPIVSLPVDVGEVDIANMPTDYPDEAVKAELEAIKQTQGEIITALQATNQSLLATNTQLTSVIKDNRLQSDTQLTGRIVEDVISNVQPVNVSGNEVINIIRNEVQKLSFVGIDIPAIPEATEGNHRLRIGYGDVNSINTLLDVLATHSTRMVYRGGVYSGSSVNITPESESSRTTLLNNVFIDDKKQLVIRYDNYSNAQQSGSRRFSIVTIGGM